MHVALRWRLVVGLQILPHAGRVHSFCLLVQRLRRLFLRLHTAGRLVSVRLLVGCVLVVVVFHMRLACMLVVVVPEVGIGLSPTLAAIGAGCTLPVAVAWLPIQYVALLCPP